MISRVPILGEITKFLVAFNPTSREVREFGNAKFRNISRPPTSPVGAPPTHTRNIGDIGRRRLYRFYAKYARRVDFLIRKCGKSKIRYHKYPAGANFHGWSAPCLHGIITTP